MFVRIGMVLLTVIREVDSFDCFTARSRLNTLRVVSFATGLRPQLSVRVELTRAPWTPT